MTWKQYKRMRINGQWFKATKMPKPLPTNDKGIGFYVLDKDGNLWGLKT